MKLKVSQLVEPDKLELLQKAIAEIKSGTISKSLNFSGGLSASPYDPYDKYIELKTILEKELKSLKTKHGLVPRLLKNLKGYLKHLKQVKKLYLRI